MTNGAATPTRIRMLREIASGPLSATFLAERTRGAIADLVSVKVLRHRTKGDVDRLLKVRDASRELAAIAHPQIVCVEEVARVGELIALISPYVDGIDIQAWTEILRTKGLAVPTKARCEIVLGIASALDAALHTVPPGRSAALGRVHRDIRPSNVMVDREGTLRVLDFATGFTTLAGRGARSGALKMGIIKYMSPGRREGKRGGPSADVYSVGILALELFRGRSLRRLQSHNPAHDRYLSEVVARLVNLGLGSESDELVLRNILLRMVAFDPDARPDVREVVQTFAGLAERARGADLRRFALQNGAPHMPDPRPQPDPELTGVQVLLLDTGSTWDEVPVYDGAEIPDRLRLHAERNAALWEETPHGWKQTGDHADTLEAFFDAEGGPDDDGPLPGAPGFDIALDDPADEDTEPGRLLPEDLLATAPGPPPTLPPIPSPVAAQPEPPAPPEPQAIAPQATAARPTAPRVLPAAAPAPPRASLKWFVLGGVVLAGLVIASGVLVGVLIALAS